MTGAHDMQNIRTVAKLVGRRYSSSYGRKRKATEIFLLVFWQVLVPFGFVLVACLKFEINLNSKVSGAILTSVGIFTALLFQMHISISARVSQLVDHDVPLNKDAVGLLAQRLKFTYYSVAYATIVGLLATGLLVVQSFSTGDNLPLKAFILFLLLHLSVNIIEVIAHSFLNLANDLTNT